MKCKNSTIALVRILVPILALVLILIIFRDDYFNLQQTNSNIVKQLHRQRAISFRLLIGILMVPDNYERRQTLRLVYSLQTPPPDVVIDVRFVFCNLTKKEQKVLVAMEIMKYDDIIILRCPENMDSGKTYTYFASLPKLFDKMQYDYIMKADDDTFFRLPWLAESLRTMPRDDLYYGFLAPCNETDPFKGWMAGMGYVLSWDLVHWISTSNIPRYNHEGPEDLVLSEWLKGAHLGKNRRNVKFLMYDVPVPFPGACMHEFVPDTIGVHKLKDNGRWAFTLEYFNFTAGLKPSKFYHFD